MTLYKAERFEEEKKKVLKEKVESNYLLIYLAYSAEYILPYEEGIKLLATLEKAEMLSGNYDNKIISPVKTDCFSVKILSREEYVNRKTATLLGLTYNEFLKASEEEKSE